MQRVLVLSLAIAALALTAAAQDYCYPLSGSYISTTASAPSLISYALVAQATVYFEGCGVAGFHSTDNYTLAGLHRITGSNYQIAASEAVSQSAYVYELNWSGTLTASVLPGTCYTNYVDARETVTGVSQGAGSGQVCVLVDPCATAYAAGDRHTLALCQQPDFTNWSDPVVISLDGSPYRFTTTQNGVRFDLDATGVSRLTAWTEAGAQVGFLALDRNGDGMINDGSELFGNRTPTGISPGHAPNGFLALASFDDNQDGIIDERDAVWSKLMLWVDSNHDGISQSSELIPLSSTSITAISTTYHWTGRKDPNGNMLLNAGKAYVGRSERPIYDVWFPRLNSSTVQ